LTTEPTRGDRKVRRRAAIDLHALSTRIAARRGHMPADEPAGYLDAFAPALRSMARLCEQARDATCVSLKRLALATTPIADDPASVLAHGRAVNALLTIVNHHAQSEGVDPYGRPDP
jgi:hypothetical protein